ncbi:hypothetical protein [Legionella fallonii]|uniref:Uncharacterized protein n=1 Tax=Legionella fallonii LLAP-10 TaxID=1212491 RepID=A0A098G7L8_9GAMM|nr:hypothetical protein [Legionella fallonii]CEG57510.1 protein of unknown function [Legionella fallonii LLAP-10]
MDNDNVDPCPSPPQDNLSKVFACLGVSVATYGLIRKGNYKAALLLYRHGGGGVNFYKQQENGDLKRIFALDYHSFWDGKQNVTKLHYHRGANSSQMKKHRPYQGGW